jgi:DNA oxidative demethylase
LWGKFEMNLSLFDDDDPSPRSGPEVVQLGPNALVFRGRVTPQGPELLDFIRGVESEAPFRNMKTPGGFTMSVALTNAGPLGWTSDESGYRYADCDPVTASPWPPMPGFLVRLSREIAEEAGFIGFEPDACLINRYVPGARMSLHQDKDERKFEFPIVSISLGLEAQFLWGGLRRADKPIRVPLYHGDVVVWGGSDRLRYHGIAPLKSGNHPITGGVRFNLTLRRAR